MHQNLRLRRCVSKIKKLSKKGFWRCHLRISIFLILISMLCKWDSIWAKVLKLSYTQTYYLSFRFHYNNLLCWLMCQVTSNLKTLKILFTSLAFSRFMPSKTSRLAKFASFSLNGTTHGGLQMKVKNQRTDTRLLLTLGTAFFSASQILREIKFQSPKNCKNNRFFWN